jgi:hypothetical protein
VSNLQEEQQINPAVSKKEPSTFRREILIGFFSSLWLLKVFDILACISDNYLLLTTAHTQILQQYPPSPPRSGDNKGDMSVKCFFILK